MKKTKLGIIAISTIAKGKMVTLMDKDKKYVFVEEAYKIEEDNEEKWHITISYLRDMWSGKKIYRKVILNSDGKLESIESAEDET